MGKGAQILTEIPFGFKGRVFRSPMPFSPYDPSGQVWPLYLEKGIDIVLVLAEMHEILVYTNQNLLDYYKSKGLLVLHFPISDYHVPEDYNKFNEVILRVMKQAESGRNIVVHCLAGVGRTGLVLAAIAKKHLGLDGESAIQWIRDYIPGSIETFAQESFIHEY